ncbi:hypothetical protein VNI00_015430 [Paramarasmius palmivorus]|uniref:Uncharacterized protein n=1 Tax=Paramarasmius palmivorus TaxID=297713 RepID=A0AAW0BKN7_9AGAR
MAYEDKIVSAPSNVDDVDLVGFNYSDPAFIEFQHILNDMFQQGECGFINNPTTIYDSSYIPPTDFSNLNLFSPPPEASTQLYDNTAALQDYRPPSMPAPAMPQPKAHLTFIEQPPVNSLRRVTSPYTDISAATTPDILEGARYEKIYSIYQLPG